jgi:antagonist of KipI
LAVCGAGGQFFIDKTAIENGRLVFAPKGSELEIRTNPDGNFTYLATPGGWDAPAVLGSRSTCLSASFGGLEGRGLRKGDVLWAADSSDNLKSSDELREGKVWISRWFVNSPTFRKLSTFGKFDNVIRTLPGPEFHWWDETQQQQFFKTPFLISKQRDRMGVRLEEPSTFRKLATFRKVDTMLSTAACPGTVQVPPDGQPIALLADAQTTGGYPRIAQVIATDIPRLAQMPTGNTIHFQQVTLEEAERLFFEQENLLRKIQLALRFVAR